MANLKPSFCVVLILSSFLQCDAQVRGSCSGRCTAGRVGNCFCNSQCRRHGDCCHDYTRHCTNPSPQQQTTRNSLVNQRYANGQVRGSCSGRCTAGRVGNCFCNSQCRRHGDCCHDYTRHCTNPSPQQQTTRNHLVNQLHANASLTDVVAAMWSSDTNRLPSTGLTLRLQARVTTTEQSDRAPQRLFANVDESILQRPTYRLMIHLLDNYVPDVNVEEHLTQEENQETEDFLQAVVETQPMLILQDYLSQRGLITNSAAALKELLRRLWFGLYRRRSRGAVSSSGFEHVIVGEVKGTKVTGFHNWIQFYLEERRDRLDYEGYVDKVGENILRAKITWRGRRKGGASMFVGVSPEFDMAVYTLCIMVKPNRDCVFRLNGNNVRVKTFDNKNAPGLQVATAFVNI